MARRVACLSPTRMSRLQATRTCRSRCISVLGILACLRWHRTREPADAALALLLLAACPLLKIPGRIWVLLAVPALIVAFASAVGARGLWASATRAVVGGLLLLAQTSPVIMGYHLHLDFSADWEAFANSFFLYDNWHLLWYGAFAVALLGRTTVAGAASGAADGGRRRRRDVPGFRAAVHQRPRMGLRPDAPSIARRCTWLRLVAIWMLVVFRAWAQIVARLHRSAPLSASAATTETASERRRAATAADVVPDAAPDATTPATPVAP